MTVQPTEFQQQLANIRARIEELRQRMGRTEDNTVKPATESILKTSVEHTVKPTVENHSADSLRAALRKRSS